MEVGSTSAAGVYTVQGEVSAANRNALDLGTDTFLKLLVAQIRYQDPFSGGQDMESFMSQVAQFTLLERVFTLQKTLEEYAAVQAPLQALNLLNRAVEIREENGSIISGKVSSVRFEKGRPLIKVGSKEYSFEAVIQVKGTE